MIKKIKNILINKKLSIKESLNLIKKNGSKCLIIVDKKNKLIGTLSDGDLRKFILKGYSLNHSIEKIFNKKPISLVKGNYSNNNTEKIFLDKKIDLIPVINNSKEVVDVIFWENLFKKKSKLTKSNIDLPIVIMAGGRGVRLEPFTKILPKPLIPIHDKPIIEHIIEKFLKFNTAKFYFSINYKSIIMKAYFEELNPKYKYEFIEEKKPLGTAGSLSSLKNLKFNDVLITNCDVIIDINYKDLIDFHKDNQFDITLVASTKQYTIPYGVCKTDKKGILINIDEKPTLNYLFNAGMYVINKNILKLIPVNKFYNITDLINKSKKNNKKVGVYPINHEDWIDTGQWNEYQKAIQKLT